MYGLGTVCDGACLEKVAVSEAWRTTWVLTVVVVVVVVVVVGAVVVIVVVVVVAAAPGCSRSHGRSRSRGAL